MENQLKRRENEDDFEYKVRLCILKLNKEIDNSWSDLINILKLDYSPEHLRKLAYGYKECYDHGNINTDSVQVKEKLKQEREELNKIKKEKESFEKEIAKLESKEEKRIKVVEEKDFYIIYSAKRQLKVFKDKIKKIKEMYCGKNNIGIAQVCRTLDISRRDFMLIKYAFNIVHDDVPFLDEELENENVNDLVDISLEKKKAQYFIKLQEKEIIEMKKELNKYREKDFLFNKIIDKLNNIKIHKNNYNVKIKPNKKKRVALLDIADLHIGLKCKNYFNEYNVKIARERIEQLTKEVIITCAELGVKELHVSNLGDILAGVIHKSIMKESEIDIGEQVKIATEIIGKMILEFSDIFDKVVYSDIVGNHGRIYPSKDECTERENFEYFVSWGLRLMLKDMPKIIIEDNFIDEGVIIKNIEGIKIYETHGHLDKFNKMASDLGMMFGKADEIHTAHYHHNKSEEFHCTEVFMSRSFEGTDSYAKNNRRTSKAGQRLYIYSQGQREFIKEIEFN